jgi:hypothetical protein
MSVQMFRAISDGYVRLRSQNPASDGHRSVLYTELVSINYTRLELSNKGKKARRV